jgi:hypothetical protein
MNISKETFADIKCLLNEWMDECFSYKMSITNFTLPTDQDEFKVKSLVEWKGTELPLLTALLSLKPYLVQK